MKAMRYYLSHEAALKWLETPSAYHIVRDELYELDQDSFLYLRKCATADGCETSDQALIDYCLAEGLLTEKATACSRPEVRPAPSPSLRYLELQLTNRCNLQCRHCYISDDAGRELSTGQIRTVLQEFEAMQGLRVLLTGGEPLLHSGFEEINEMLPALFLHSVLFTNGLLLTRRVLDRLNVHEIQISIDGMREAHDALRGTGSWDGALRALQAAIDAGFPVSVSTMVHRANLADFDAMHDLFRALNVGEWNVDVPCTAGRLTKNRDLSLSPLEGGKYLAYGYGGGMHGSDKGYGCGLHLMAVLPSGSAAKCTFYSDRPVGMIGEGLRVCWKRVQPVRLDALTCACEHVESCRGGCRYRAELLEGPGGRDLYRCARYGVIDKSGET